MSVARALSLCREPETIDELHQFIHYVGMIASHDAGDLLILHFDRVVSDDEKQRRLIDTVCVVRDGDGELAFGVAVLSTSDQYHRKMGNLIAYRRALKDLSRGVTFPAEMILNAILSELSDRIARSQRDSTYIGRRHYSYLSMCEHYEFLIERFAILKEVSRDDAPQDVDARTAPAAAN